MSSRRLLHLACWPLVALLLLFGTASCSNGSDSSDDSSTSPPEIVVTFPILAAVLRPIVGDQASVEALMPAGADPHEWSPSARDVETLSKADLVIANGLGLDASVDRALDAARKDGVKVFVVADHVTVRRVRAGEGADAADPDQAPGAEDPHLWTDPLTMRAWIDPVVPVLESIGVDAKDAAAAESKALEQLDRDVRALVDTVPAERRTLVTGHESLGYFAERYGFRLVGAVIPNVSSQAEPSAGDLAALTEKIKEAKVPAVFSEIGTPRATVEAVSSSTGAKVVEVGTHTLPADGTYRTFLLELATTITDALR